MPNQKILVAAQGVADVLDCTTKDLKGKTLRDSFSDCENVGGVTVYWGMWTEEELNTVL